MRRARLALAVAIGGVLTLGAGLSVMAQTSSGNQASGEASAGAGAPAAGSAATPQSAGLPASANAAPTASSPQAATPPASNALPKEGEGEPAKAATNSLPAKQAAAPPPAPPKPVRSQVAVLQALDKVTAETIRFAAPVGQPIRYKNLVFVVKACETSDLGQPSPTAAAYVVIDSAPLGAEGFAPPPAKQVFKGWMFANSPGLNPFQHPVYDAWLISCAVATPPA